jgi:hypothetical protein
MKTTNAFTFGLAAALALAAGPARAENHRQYADSKPEECRECHRGSGVMENHGLGFARDHRLLAQKQPNNCYDCHQQAWCSDCHHGGNSDHPMDRSLSRRGETMPETHRADYISIHSIKATDDPKSCQRCHETAKFCNDCHARSVTKTPANYQYKPHAPTFVGGQPDPAWVSFHRAEARRNLTSCQSCHPSKSDCSSNACHPGLGGR